MIQLEMMKGRGILKRVKTIEEWRQLLAGSNEQPALLFKFSMTCVSSITAQKELKKLTTTLPIYIVLVQPEREVSNAIEADLGVKHESPQLLLLKGGRGVWQATHYHIKKRIVAEAIELYG